MGIVVFCTHGRAEADAWVQPVLPPSFPIVLRRVAWRRRMTPDFDEEVVFEVRGKWRCVWVAFVWEGRGRRREADRRSEGSGDAPAGLGHRISSISGPSVGRCLTGVARGALASPSLCLGPSQNSQPDRWTRALRVPPRVMDPPWRGVGLGNCSWLGRGPIVHFGYSPVRFSSPFFVLDFWGLVSRSARGHRSLSRRGSFEWRQQVLVF